MSPDIGLTQDYTGRCVYIPDYSMSRDTLLVALPCLIEGRHPEVYPLLDTASHWSVLPSRLAGEVGIVVPDESGYRAVERIRTGRSGIITGWLENLWVRLPAVEGEDVDLQVTCFISDEWTGPFVLGWKGCLESIRIGLDPSTDSFYFGDL